MTKATTITDTATAVDACQQLALTGLAPVLGDVFDDATRRRISHPTFLAEALRIELDVRQVNVLLKILVFVVLAAKWQDFCKNKGEHN